MSKENKSISLFKITITITISLLGVCLIVYFFNFHKHVSQKIIYDLDSNSYEISTYAHIGTRIVKGSFTTTGRSHYIYKHADGDVNEISLKEREKMEKAIEIFQSKMRAVK